MDGLFPSTPKDCTGNFQKQTHGQSTKRQGQLAHHATCLICLHWGKAEEHGGQRPRVAQRCTAGLNGSIKPASVFHFFEWCGQNCSDFTQLGYFTLAKNFGVNVFLAKGKIFCAPKMLARSQRIFFNFDTFCFGRVKLFCMHAF